MAELLGVELARPGTWNLASGPLYVTPQMLADAARYAARDGARPSPVKLGHTDPRFSGDGEPALGWLANLRVEGAGDDAVLLGDITGMPDWLASAAPSAWPDRSIEGWQDYVADGERYSLVIDGLALLGVTPPGMSTIRSLRDLPQALGVAASARIVARLGAVETPAPEADAPSTEEGAGHVDPAKIREALGLAPDASDDEVKAQLVAAGLAQQPNPPNPPNPEPQPEPESESESDKEFERMVTAAAKAGGVVTIDAGQLAQFQDGMKTAAALKKRLDEQDRDATITAAIKAGKFEPSRRGHWERAWDADPEGAKKLIASLASGLVPVTAMGYAGDGEDAMWEAEFGRLFPPSGGR